MKFLSKMIENLTEYRSLRDAAASGALPLCAVGLSLVHKAHLVYALQAETGLPALLLTGDEIEARRLTDDLNAMAGEDIAVLYPYREFAFRDVEASREYEHGRLTALGRLQSGRAKIIVASAIAAAQYTLPPDRLRSATLTLRPADRFELDDLAERLLRAGYERRPQVEGIGQFSVRGGIVDFFPPSLPDPVRIEFWGDEIDTISTFDAETQRRIDTVRAIEMPPAREVLFQSPEALTRLIRSLREGARGKRAAEVKAELDRELERLDSGLGLSSYDKFLPVAYDAPATLFDYFTGEHLLFGSDFTKMRETLGDYDRRQQEDIKILFEDGVLFKGLDHFNLDFTEYTRRMERGGVILMETFARQFGELPLKNLISFDAVQLSPWTGDVATLIEDVGSYLALGYGCVVLAGTERAARALVSDLAREGVPADYFADPASVVLGKVMVVPSGLSAGFEYRSVRMALITHSRGGNAGATVRRTRRKEAGERIRAISDIAPGDYVVHVAHGIGVFEGIEKMDIHGVVKDYIKIRYAGSDILYVPVTQLDLVSKYIGGREDAHLKLHKLGGTEWQKTRSRVKSAVKDMAKELTELYAKRMQAKGFAFSPDTEWQRDFETRFEYDETDDQLKCIAEIKHDMEAQAPMDRLLCGDVGFGKTEVALRAAFKAVMDGKQVAVLVPTTILAWQHYQTMLRRMEGFPIEIELLSRYRTPRQQDAIISRLRRGSVDIVVGTHRIVQKDIKFKDLGLVIIDEEQRFGVAHKEKFKEMCAGVDVLTLTATPIPRTLNMAMSGIRDMSTLDEAPGDRHPVQTYVIEQDDRVLFDAIRRELRRGGQVYYLHNHIDSIEARADAIGRAIPEARIATAHGRMSEEEISSIWERLIQGEIDILVCTTIIETGIDVPNVNTLIIENADRMGLSQLYQLRGRVGRSNRRAYAYMTFRRGQVISDIAARRLSAIREFTRFGSGFAIAMRDLEIRGAGSILGAHQHGHMEAVGYDLYLKLLSEAVSEQRGEPAPEAEEECLIDIRMEAHIPERYIENLAQRFDIYRRIAQIKGESDAEDVIDELVDRFGDPPAAVKGLIDVALLRGMAASLGIYEINDKNGAITLYPRKLDMERISRLVSTLKGRVMVSAGAKPYITVRMAEGEKPTDTMRKALNAMAIA